MISENKDFFFSAGYFGRLNPNSEEDLLYHEKWIGIKSDDKSFYKYNNLGFRCDDFKKTHDGMHVLFGGCSETEGSSNALEDVWAKVLYNKIKEDNDVSGYYNVGKSGLTLSLAILNIFQYINDYGVPDYIFLQAPDQLRVVSWSKDKGIHPLYQSKYENNYKNKKQSTVNLPDLEDFVENNLSAVDLNLNAFFNKFMIRTLIQFCKINSINFIWSTWHPSSYEVDILNEDSGYVSTEQSGKDHWGVKIKDLVARDGYHLGKGFHKIWADKFYGRFIYDQNNKKNAG